tara:strand:- start:357 stop:1019 length:663 start_codon:yes stop_codon:yes gene_type:complete
LLQLLQLAELLLLCLLSSPASLCPVVAFTVPTRNSSIPSERREHDDAATVLPLSRRSRLGKAQGHNGRIADSPSGSSWPTDRSLDATDREASGHRGQRRVAVELDVASRHPNHARIATGLRAQEDARRLVGARDTRSGEVSRLTFGVLDRRKLEEGASANQNQFARSLGTPCRRAETATPLSSWVSSTGFLIVVLVVLLFLLLLFGRRIPGRGRRWVAWG